MVEEEGQEEGEYHFSDDQANYDMEAEAGKDSATVVTATPKESITAQLTQRRRLVIGLVIFIVLLGIVYKLITPSSTSPTELQPSVTAAPQKMPAKKPVPPPAPVAQAPTVQAPAAQQTTVTTTTVAQPTAPVNPTPTTPTVSSQPAAPAAVAQAPVVTSTTTSSPAEEGAVQNRNVLDRVATLERQNADMMNLVQTQYAQKITDTELQNTQLRTEVQELNTRISNMEVAFRQLTKILKDMSSGAATAAPTRSGSTGSRAAQPRNTYTVQAIIPGRAWLKSDSGDTVTVAEGDVLKGYGRIAKIDPYDGVVDIDTGNKIISLSYGANGD